MKNILYIFCVIGLFLCGNSHAQTLDPVAENMLIYQRGNGGWSKSWSLYPINYDRKLSPEQIEAVKADEDHYRSTIDNDATTTEINYLIKAYQKTKNAAYLASVEKGIAYLLKAQYANGGWPQFYPLEKGYYTHITYNDNAMMLTMSLLKNVAEGKEGYDAVNKDLATRSAKAVNKGIDCILKTQVRVNGKLTVWCAQHDEHTLLPAPARAFELVSLSGLESVDIVAFLMAIKDPSPEVKAAIMGAMDWFDRSKISGFDLVRYTDTTQIKGSDVKLVKDPGSTIWARFYNIDTNQPFFVGKDGIARASVYDIENERRAGYSWYGHWANKLLTVQYPEWLKANHITIKS